MSKKILLEIFKIISFVLVFIILITVVSSLFFSEKAVFKKKSNRQDLYTFFEDPPNTIQVVGVGNSDLYSGFSPLDLWARYGVTSTVCAMPLQKIRDSKDLLTLVFKSQSPQIVLIETDMLYERNPSKVNVVRQSNIISELINDADPKFFAEYIESKFTIFKFHNIWKKRRRDIEDKLYNTHGYRYNNHVCKLKLSNYMKETTEYEPISKRNIKQMDELLALCKSKNVTAIMVAVPSPSSWNYKRHNAVTEYAKERGVSFIDLNLYYKDMGLDMRTCFRDKGNHLNYSGAKIVTMFLGEYIQKTYHLPVHSGEAGYHSWDKDLKYFEMFRKKDVS